MCVCVCVRVFILCNLNANGSFPFGRPQKKQIVMPDFLLSVETNACAPTPPSRFLFLLEYMQLKYPCFCTILKTLHNGVLHRQWQ
jgi:hypothetical protein